MLERVAIVAAADGTAELTYAIPAALEGRVEPGHRVLVPIRSRRVTGIVVETGENLESGGAQPRPLLEVLEARPLFRRTTWCRWRRHIGASYPAWRESNRRRRSSSATRRERSRSRR